MPPHPSLGLSDYDYSLVCNEEKRGKRIGYTRRRQIIETSKINLIMCVNVHTGTTNWGKLPFLAGIRHIYITKGANYGKRH
ncbi:MAG: hypothetical protein ABI865_03955, partial [Nitrosospira sp.]